MHNMNVEDTVTTVTIIHRSCLLSTMVVHLTCNQMVVGSTPMEGPKGSTHFFQLKSGAGFGHFSKKEKMTLYGAIV